MSVRHPGAWADGRVQDAVGLAGTRRSETAPWFDALSLLAESAASEGGMHDEGLAAFRTRLLDLVEERLAAEAMLASYPEIRARPITARFVVAGLARSGTTLLHRLLSCDPDVEFLPTWQAFHPVPPASGPDDRRDRTVQRIAAMRAADPDMAKVHPIEADAPEEEVFLLQHSFASMLFALTCPLPSYNAWLSTTEHREAYQLALDLLRLNEWRSGVPEGRPRVMKSPQYVLDLAVVGEVLPEAIVVQTHRDPVDLVGSYCSTYERSRGRACIEVDRIALGEERLAHLHTMASRSAAARRAAGADGRGDRFVDVRYDDLVARPLAVVERLYAAAGLELRAETYDAIERWLAANPQNRAGRHEYDLSAYGLDRATVEEHLGAEAYR